MRAAIVFAMSFFALPAQAHCFSKWYYNFPQHCGITYVQPKHMAYAVIPSPPIPPARDIDISLPDLTNITWGGAMDTELELQMQRQKALHKLKGEH
jgi:hypothetical protein